MSFMDMSPQSVQKLMLTPKMALSMHVLQLNIMDLRVFIRAELEENPFLEETSVESEGDQKDENIAESISLLVDSCQDSSMADMEKSDSEGLQKQSYLESLITKKESLYDHLLWQLHTQVDDEEDRRLGEFIIGSLDENGFFIQPLEELQPLSNADDRRFHKLLNLVRTFDPCGVGARNVQECLLLQLIASGKGEHDLYKIVHAHLEDLEKGHYQKIAHELDISLETVRKAAARLSEYNPKPGAAYTSGNEPPAIEPDVFAVDEAGSFVPRLNSGTPAIRINFLFRTLLRQKSVSDKTKEYIRQQTSHALWLLNAVRQRDKTINRVCAYVFNVQKVFFKEGEAGLQPLSLRHVAERLAVSEATISRTVANKYLQSSDGLYPLKKLFSRGVKTNSGNVISQEAVKQKICDLIGDNDQSGPLTDEAICAALRHEGIQIARRTVAKYRLKLEFLSSARREKKVSG